MATALSSFLPFVLPEVPGCPGPLAEQRVLTACIEFCERTQYWRYESDPMPMEAGIDEYEVDIPSGSQLVSIIDPIKFNGAKIYGTTKELLDKNESDDWQDNQGDTPFAYYNKSLGVFRPVPYPETTISDAIKLDLALKPLPDATTVEDFLFTEFFQAIADGALAKLFALPGKAWGDPTMSAHHAGLFDDAMNKAATKAKSGFRAQERYSKSKAHFF